MSEVTVSMGAFAILVFLGFLLHRREQSREAAARLSTLAEKEMDVRAKQALEQQDWARGRDVLAGLATRLGKAGFLTRQERRFAVRILVAITASGAALGAIWGTMAGGTLQLVLPVVGLYLGGMAALVYLSASTRDFQREILFQIPLTLEKIILLVESGLGILPALQRVVASDEIERHPNPVVRLLRLVYEFAAHGVPFGQALEMVADAVEIKPLRHVLLHLDISGNEGGELIPSLRGLSEHAHLEWKLSVEQRVKRLENFVVFPVFASVLGLMLLTAAVPIVPVIKFTEQLKTQAAQTTAKSRQPLALEESKDDI